MQEINQGILMLHLLLTGSVEGKAAVQILKHTKSSVFLNQKKASNYTKHTQVN